MSLKKNKQLILITGCAGFIGYHLTLSLSKNNNYLLFGIDNLNDYYDINLKKDRLKNLKKYINNFNFFKIDISNEKAIRNNFNNYKYDYVINLAAQAGVRYSIDNPRAYLKSNIDGFFNILDHSNRIKVKHLIYASTSSVYGDSKDFPLKENFHTSSPQSFYAATKKSNEIMAHAYSSIFKLPTTGLRFFTVYGPYGRPDMALFKFTKAILEDKTISLFNSGNHVRDFTYIDDITNAISKIIEKPKKNKLPYQIFNIGSGDPKKLTLFLSRIEKELNKKSKKIMKGFQLGDVKKTHANIDALSKVTSFKPKNNINSGIKKFIDWYKKYYSK
ncbi:NAD-dependent epimerase/dehydratase family protein [Pelagibacterales bacterium]|nr:NAD-dependent epimerase/dehydratase family protein [Pelagibacterales bacterium]